MQNSSNPKEEPVSLREKVHPQSVRLEASTFCQLKCPICNTATGDLYKNVAKGNLKAEKFRQFVEANPQVKNIEISNFGEVFLNPQLEEIFKTAHAHGVRITILNGTNLNNVRPQVLEAVVKYQVRGMRISLDGASQETYKQYRIGGNFDRVIENIRTINEHKQKYRSNYPELVWQFVAFGHNEHEIGKAKALAKELGMEFDLKLNWDEDYSPVKDKEAVRKEISSGVASRSEFRDKTGVDYMEYVCHQLWDKPQINWDGKVYGCCRNDWKAFGGNVFEDGFEAAINDDTMNQARAMLQGEAEPSDDIPCTTCRIYKAMRKNGRYLDRVNPNTKRN